MSEVLDPYAEGIEAALTGRCMADCPYEYNSDEGKEWISGFESTLFFDL